MQQKFASFKERHNNVFRKSKNFRSSARPFFQEIDLSSNRPAVQEEEEEGEGDTQGGERKYGKRIDQIRKKLREVLAYSSRATETSSSIERTFLPAHLKTEVISPTPTTEILLSLSTSYPSPQIFRPEFRKNILGRLNRKRFPKPQSEESSEEIQTASPSEEEEEEEEYLADTDSAAEDYYDEGEDYIEIVSSRSSSPSVFTPSLYVSTSSSVIVPKPIIDPVASTKTISGIPRKYTYEEEDRYNQFVNVDTELEGGESQNVDVITANNDRIGIEEEDIKQLAGRLQSDNAREGEKHVKVNPGPQLPLYNMFSPYDLTSLPYLNTKQTTPSINNLEVTPSLPSLLPSLPRLEELYSLPTSTTPSLPALPALQYPVLSPEQLSYIHLLKHGFNPLQQLPAVNPVSTVTNTRVKTTSVTLTETQEYK